MRAMDHGLGGTRADHDPQPERRDEEATAVRQHGDQRRHSVVTARAACPHGRRRQGTGRGRGDLESRTQVSREKQRQKPGRQGKYQIGHPYR